ncbi:MAG TPA: DUF6272 family protein, partial [Vicingus sp.]|nr:DUF6272 family protein [Vicingus sp.]
MDNIHDFYNMMEDGNIMLSFKGEVTSDLLTSILQIMESKMETLDEPPKIKKKVYNILVECLQNLYHHIDEDDALNLVGEKRPVGRPIMGTGYKDQEAAGRMYAQRHFPIKEGEVCEWAWSKNAGGGVNPIIGCSGRPAKHIHHGPDKSVLNNDRESNISKVCAHCHNLYHARNDEFYPGTRPIDGGEWIPIPPEGEQLYSLADKEPASLFEIIEHETKLGRDLAGAKER